MRSGQINSDQATADETMPDKISVARPGHTRPAQLRPNQTRQDHEGACNKSKPICYRHMLTMHADESVGTFVSEGALESIG